MSYRDEREARAHRQAALQQELAGLESEMSPLSERAKSLRRDLDQLRRDDERMRRRVKLPALARAVISSPCPKSWDEMKGDDRKRFCGACKKNVYNVAALTIEEAESLLGRKDGEVCARIFRRPDGTIMTSDCGPGRWRRRGRRAAVVAAAAGLSLAASGPLMGEAEEPAIDCGGAREVPVAVEPAMGAGEIPVAVEMGEVEAVEEHMFEELGEMAVADDHPVMGRIAPPASDEIE